MTDPRLIGLTPQRESERVGNHSFRLAILERRGAAGGSSGSVADATTTVKGKVKLAGDFEGTADLPYVRKGSTTDSGTLGVYDLRRFGAVEGGDILAALQAAQSAMPSYGGEIHINLWRVNLSDTFTITKPIRIVGLGRGTYNRAEDLAGGAAFYNPTTIITWSGSAGGGPFFHTNGTSRPLGDVWFKNLACNGNNSATLVFDFDRAHDGGMENIIVKSLGATGVALRMRTARGESVTVQNAANTITLSNHGYSNGDVVYVSGTGVPGGLTAHTAYYVVGATTNTLQLALTAGGAAIDITSDGSAVILSDQPANQPHVHNTQSCTFTHLHFDCPLPIEMIGGQGRQEVTSQLWNVCLNHFEDCKLVYGWTDATGIAENTDGLDIWDGDNNTFVKLRTQHLGTGTGFGVDFHAAARGNYFFHAELEGGCKVRVPDSLSAGHLNHFEGYDRTNTEALPTIDAGARLRWTASGHSATGHWINAGQTSQINGSTYYSLFVGGEVSGQPRPNVEIAAKTYVNDSTASFDAVGKDGATDVWGKFSARDAGDVVIGAASDHPVVFMKNATEVFRINASNRLEWGGDVTLYRSAAGVLRVERPSGGSTAVQLVAATDQGERIDFVEGSTVQWRIWHTANESSTPLFINDAVGARRVLEFSNTGQINMRAAPDAGAFGLRFELPGTIDITDSPTRMFHAPSGFTGGSNGSRGDDVTTQTSLTDATYYKAILLGTGTFNTKGAYIPFQIATYVDPPTGASFPNTYNEYAGIVNAQFHRNKGSYATMHENVFANFSTTKGWDYGNGEHTGTFSGAGPALVSMEQFFLHEYNTYASYNSDTIFGTGSTGGHARYKQSGSRIMSWSSSGDYPVGTGLYVSLGTGFQRVMVINDSSGVDRFCIDGEGRIAVNYSTNQDRTLAAALTLGYTSAGAESTAAADGILFGDDTNLYRGAADVLRTDDNFGINQSAGGAPAAAAGGWYFTNAGAANSYRTTTGVILRGYMATGAGADAQPKFRISSTTNGADIEWGPGGSTAPDVNLFRTSGGALRTDDAFEVGGALTVVGISNLTGAVGASNVSVTGGSNTAFFGFNENAGNVAAGTQDTAARMYMTGNKIVVVFNDGGTTKYHYIDLTATANQQWTYSATAP